MTGDSPAFTVVCMLDLLIRHAAIPHEADRMDIGIYGGRIVEISPSLSIEARETIDGSDKTVLPPFVDAHFHLDSVLTNVPNESGTLQEGIDNWLRYKRNRLTVEDVYERANAYCERALRMGIQAIRSHVDVCDPELRGVRALTRLRAEWADRIEIQLVAFPQDGYFAEPAVRSQLVEALDFGVDVVGGIPHNERTMQLGTESIHELLLLAAERGLRVDMHCDESDDPQSRHVEVLTAETARLGLQGRVTASHVTSMSVMDRYYVSRKLIPNIVGAGVNVVTNPLINVHLGGHFSHPQHRAMAPLKELRAAGISVACAQDCNQDPWYPLGNADMLEVAKMGAHISHMMGLYELEEMIDTVTSIPARIMGLEEYGVYDGATANLVVLDAPNPLEALRTSAARSAVIRYGKRLV